MLVLGSDWLVLVFKITKAYNQFLNRVQIKVIHYPHIVQHSQSANS